ncbi:MAG: hypothetical protein AAB383_05440 [Patescibacteria group bacterium]
MNSLKPSIVILGGNHKALTESKKGHNGGKIKNFDFQEEALNRACEVYKQVIEQGLPAHLFTAIDHIGGKRVLTGRRENADILNVEDLIAPVRAPIMETLARHNLNSSVLKVIPERTLVEHSMNLHKNEVLTEAGVCAAYKEGGRAICKGLAAAYIDLAAREALKSGPVSSVDFFIQVGASSAIPSQFIYTSGASIVRNCLVEQPAFPKWTDGAVVRGFHCIDDKLSRIS